MDDLLDSKGVAHIIGVKQETILWYHKRGIMPAADGRFGRTPVWRKQTIDDWDASRRSVTVDLT